ncbi:integrase core domain protein [Ancylostoma caninum]|uniref:Integrase core domain protein n=1 Tax=Ancylostoma caninum TaxID=29170 RepID=A0A368H7Z3_ANCCA|nr:integrase core domain protein [Ancylostoma caninum]
MAQRSSKSQENLLTFYSKRIPFGLICSPFLLAATIHLHLTKTATPLAHEILTSCYVDNIFLSATSKEKAEQKYYQTKELFKLAGMNVREWTSSDEQVNDTINSHGATPMDKTVKILCIQWRTTTDTLTIRLPSVEEQASHPTKRHVLKLVASIFDPLGIISPVTVRAKIFLQSLWKDNMQWDQLLPLHSQQQWKDITDSWTFPLLEIPRRILPRSTRQISYQLHVFTDASQAAYCAVAYLRSTTDVGTDVKLLMGRTRLSPLHSAITIPRLELSALALGSTLMKHVVKEMNIQFDQQYLWSDSKAALQWVKTTTRLPIFISNRVKSIKSNTADAIFRHVPSSSNPADIGSRGTSVDELLKNDQWWNGPSFLKMDEQQWPEDKSEDNSVDETINYAVNTNMETKSFNGTEEVIKANNFSSWKKTLAINQPKHPFYNCGIDYAGPFLTKGHDDETKVWIALFTCLNTRAIYIDIATSLSATSFLNILRRFISSNGCPRWILSDNAPAFTSVASALAPIQSQQNQNLLNYCSHHDIRFKFISAFAPWQGGVYERMIKTFKSAFKAAIRNRKLGLDEFATLAKECEAIVNSRPITYVYNDLDSGYPLRPIDFLRPFALLGSPRLQDEYETDDEWTPGNSTDDLHKRWTSTLTLLNSFWKRWQEGYLTSLREQYQRKHRQPHLTSQETPQLDHIVLIHDSWKPRGQWKLARIVDRSDHCVTLKLSNGQTITRPFNLLYPLELPSSKAEASKRITENTKGHPTSTDETTIRRPQRTHPMITRSLKRNTSFALLTIIQLLLITVSADITSYTPPNTKCTSRAQTINTLIYADQCTSQGIAVATSTTKDKKPSFCWLQLTCPLGHIRVPMPQVPIRDSVEASVHAPPGQHPAAPIREVLFAS